MLMPTHMLLAVLCLVEHIRKEHSTAHGCSSRYKLQATHNDDSDQPHIARSPGNALKVLAEAGYNDHTAKHASLLGRCFVLVGKLA